MNPEPNFSASDDVLLRRLRAGDAEAENLFFARHLESAYAFARRALGSGPEAEDAVAEAFLRAHRALESFRGESAFRTWLLTIVHRAVLDARRRAAREGSPAPLDDAPDPADAAPGPAAFSRATELGDALDAALSRLSPRCREAIHLRVRAGLPYDEIATILGVREEAARVAVFEARRRLEQLLAPFLADRARRAPGAGGAP